MRRGVTAERTKKLLRKLRNEIPDITIRTTFIVGYPNESLKDFNELCDFIREIEFDRIGTFSFSVEENTSSFILGDPVPEEEKERRKNILMEIQKDISLKKNESFIGKKLKVLVEAVEGDFYIGRSYRDAPEVDGEILISKKNNKVKISNFYDIVINDYDEYDLYGDVC
jgi:ribosomal protein S12 methylthiotransferase